MKILIRIFAISCEIKEHLYFLSKKNGAFKTFTFATIDF